MSRSAPKLDYLKFGESLHEWSDLEEFLDVGMTEGVHRLTMDDSGLSIDLQLVNWDADRLAKQQSIPVFFSAAIANRSQSVAPFFSGKGIADAEEVAAILLADPSICLDEGLSLAWYAGSKSQSAQEHIANLLRRVSSSLEKEMLCIGGSGGGFAACYFAAQLGVRGSALLWNPQTDIFKYYRAAVTKYREVCWPDVEQGSAEYDALGFDHSLVALRESGCWPRRVVYLQNGGDHFHIDNHALPLLSKFELVCVCANGYASTDGSTAVMFATWSEGHGTLPRQIVRGCMRKMLDAHTSPVAVVRWVHGLPMTTKMEDDSAPTILCAEAELLVSATGRDGKVAVAASVREGNSQKFEYAFYLLDGSERVGARWYSKRSSVSIPVGERSDKLSVVAFARDSRGCKLQAASPVSFPEPEEKGRVGETQASIFILGSCVSRDAFSMASTNDKLVNYVARTSLSCAFGPGACPQEVFAGLAGIKSPWQRRVVEIELRRSLEELLRTAEYDYLILDLIDERFSTADFCGFSVTISPEFVSMGFERGIGRKLRADDQVRWEAWKSGVQRLVDLVGEDRIILNEIYWATHRDDGHPLDEQAVISAMNRTLRRMYSHIRGSYGVRVIEYPKHFIFSSRNHKWGVAPFHYVLGLYEHTLHSLEAIKRDN